MEEHLSPLWHGRQSGLFSLRIREDAVNFNMQARMRARKKKAPASIHFTTKKGIAKKDQPCVFAACIVGGTQVGPIWGHQKQSIDRALATLSKRCECPAKFHNAVEFSGFRIGPGGE